MLDLDWLMAQQGRAPPSRALTARRAARREELAELRREEALRQPQKRKGLYRILKRVRSSNAAATQQHSMLVHNDTMTLSHNALLAALSLSLLAAVFSGSTRCCGCGCRVCVRFVCEVSDTHAACSSRRCCCRCLPACLLQAVVREKSTTDSKKLGVLVEGQRVRVVSSRQRDGVERCKVALPPGIKGERGWVSLVRILSLSVSLSLRTCAPALLPRCSLRVAMCHCGNFCRGCCFCLCLCYLSCPTNTQPV